MAYQQEKWHHSGTDCCSPVSSCLLAWCCPCILYGKTRHRVKSQGNMTGYSACNGSCLGFCGLTCLGVSWILPMIRRGDMRAKYHLEGDGCKDCLCACCCSPCDLVQQDKEAAYREGNTTTHQQPPKMDNMAYKPQPAQGPPQPGQYAPQQGQYPQQPGQYAQQQYPQGQYTHQQY